MSQTFSFGKEWKFTFRFLRDDTARINFHLQGDCPSIIEEAKLREILDSAAVQRLGMEW